MGNLFSFIFLTFPLFSFIFFKTEKAVRGVHSVEWAKLLMAHRGGGVPLLVELPPYTFSPLPFLLTQPPASPPALTQRRRRSPLPHHLSGGLLSPSTPRRRPPYPLLCLPGRAETLARCHGDHGSRRSPVMAASSPCSAAAPHLLFSSLLFSPSRGEEGREGKAFSGELPGR